MSRNVTVGLDGSPESRAAAEWAAREAKLRGLPLRLVHVREPETAEGVRLRHPGVHVETEQIPGRPADALARAAKAAELLVLGSRGLSGIAGFLVGSVGMAVIADTEIPVVLVRAGEQAADEHEADPAGIPSAATAHRPVVLGLDTGHPHDTVIAFAFEESARRGTSLRVVHGWNLPPYSASLVVVGRRIRRSPIGVHIGSVTHAVLHHATAPVAVVAHD
ncbi:universal stress protein [Streptomyces canus]|uniref:universal stress protein n=1 Tax=Streptomyces canus TaxID=58343 RepID=UPI0037F68E76